jgi:hypothetical protein
MGPANTGHDRNGQRSATKLYTKRTISLTQFYTKRGLQKRLDYVSWAADGRGTL